MASMSHLFLFLLGMSSLVNQAAAGSGGLEDALVLVQQRANSQSQSSSLETILTEHFHANPNDYNDVVDKVVNKVGEKRLQQFWERMIEIGQAPNMSRPLRGLVLLQEAGKIIGARGGPTDFIWDSWVYKKMMEGKSEGSACWVTRASFLADIGDLTIAIAYPVGKSCKKPALCVASAFDILRAVVYTMREIAAYRYSYCAGEVNTKVLCRASVGGIIGEFSGVVHSSVSLSYKCNANTYNIGDSSSKIFGVIDARKFMCTWDSIRGGAYFLIALYRTVWFILLKRPDEAPTEYTNKDGIQDVVKKHNRGAEEIGQSGAAYGYMALGGFSWVTNAIIAAATKCPDDSGSSGTMASACSKESFELGAYISQFMAYLTNMRDYCYDKYKKNELRNEFGNEEDFRKQVQEDWQALVTMLTDLNLKEDEIEYIVEEMFIPEVGAKKILEKELTELRKSVSVNAPMRKSMSHAQMDDLIRVVAIPKQNQRLSVMNPRLSVLNPRLSVLNPHSNVISPSSPLSLDNHDSNSLSVPQSKGHVVGKSGDHLSVTGQGVPIPVHSNPPQKSVLGIVVSEHGSEHGSPKTGILQHIPVTISEVDEANSELKPGKNKMNDDEDTETNL